MADKKRKKANAVVKVKENCPRRYDTTVVGAMIVMGSPCLYVDFFACARLLAGDERAYDAGHGSSWIQCTTITETSAGPLLYLTIFFYLRSEKKGTRGVSSG
jgi:hypothetical protein